jgi:hypothetical protein
MTPFLSSGGIDAQVKSSDKFEVSLTVKFFAEPVGTVKARKTPVSVSKSEFSIFPF